MAGFQEEEFFVLKGFRERTQNMVDKRRKDKALELTVRLDGEARMRFDRLKKKLPKADEDRLIILALKCLEQKCDMIFKRQATKGSQLEKSTPIKQAAKNSIP